MSYSSDQNKLISELPVYYPGISGCRNVDKYKFLNQISEGTYGVVYKAVEQATDEIVALKRLKLEREQNGFPITSLREINTLMKCRMHPNIVSLKEIVIDSILDHVYIVMEFIDNDLKSLLDSMKQRKKKFQMTKIKSLMHQLLSGCAYMHSEWVIHRDLKTSNLLLTPDNVLKIGDFGLAREYGDPPKEYTQLVVTLWYRSPELLLGSKNYSTAIDIWSVGAIFGELLRLEPMFPGTTELEQLKLIFQETGTPNKLIWPTCDELPGMKNCYFADMPYNRMRETYIKFLRSEAGMDLLNRLLTLDPSRRINAETALNHPFFAEENESPPKKVSKRAFYLPD